MPRAGQVKPPVKERLSDRIAIGVLTSAYPLGLVDRVVAEAGRTQERQRLLPTRVVVFTLAMCLFGQVGYQEVARLGAGGLAGAPLAAVVAGAIHPCDRQGPRAARRCAGQAVVCRGRRAAGHTLDAGGRGVREISRVAGVTNLGVLQDHQAAELAFVLS